MSNTVKVFNFQAYLNNSEVPFLNTAWDGLDKSLKFMMDQFIQPKIGDNLSDFRGKDVALLHKAWNERNLDSLVKTFNIMADVRVEYDSFESEELEESASVVLPQFPEYEEFDGEDVDSMFKGTFEEEASLVEEEEATEEEEVAEAPPVVVVASAKGRKTASIPVAKEEEPEDTDLGDDEEDDDDSDE
jgi:hypothetical protein